MKNHINGFSVMQNKITPHSDQLSPFVCLYKSL